MFYIWDCVQDRLVNDPYTISLTTKNIAPTEN